MEVRTPRSAWLLLAPTALGHPRHGACRCEVWASCVATVVFFAIVPDFSMCTSLAYSWREEAQAPLIAPLEGAQRVSTLGHPWHRNTCESACVAVRCGRVQWLKSYFFAFVSMRTSLACVWKDEACAPLSAPPEAHNSSQSVAFEVIVEESLSIRLQTSLSRMSVQRFLSFMPQADSMPVG